MEDERNPAPVPHLVEQDDPLFDSRNPNNRLIGIEQPQPLREAAHQALGALKALGAENGYATEALRAALAIEGKL